MTIASAFNEIAVAQGGTASKSGTIAGAIDALTDALAGSDVQSPDTIEGAVRLLGQHIGGDGGDGGDGGGSFGSLQNVCISENLPSIGEDAFAVVNISEIINGSTVIAQGITGPVAAGLTAISSGAEQFTECDAYVCGVDENNLYTTVTPWDGTVTVGSVEIAGATYATYTLTVPELDFDPETLTGEYLVLYVHEA